MPIVHVQLVVAEGEAAPAGAAQAIADVVAAELGASPGRVWVRLDLLPQGRYAENGGRDADVLPVFVSVLHADLPATDALRAQAARLAGAMAGVLERAPELVHIEYAPAGRGRVAFGGRLVE